MPSSDDIAQWRAEDREFLLRPKSWPNDPVCMKTPSWLPGEQRLGLLSSKHPLTVVPDSGPPETYPDLDALLAVWCVD